MYSLLQRMADEERARYYYNKALQELKEEEPETNWEQVTEKIICDEFQKDVCFDELEMPKDAKFYKI